MEAFEVITGLRRSLLDHALQIKALQSQVTVLERFTWNLVQLMIDGVDIEITLDDPREEDPHGSPQDEQPTLFDLGSAPQADLGPQDRITVNGPRG